MMPVLHLISLVKRGGIGMVLFFSTKLINCILIHMNNFHEILEILFAVYGNNPKFFRQIGLGKQCRPRSDCS